MPTGSSSAASTWGRTSRGRSCAARGTSATGATVAVALPGAVLPGGTKLERAKLRGEVSDGMILSERELELGHDHSGILVLAGGEPGTPLGDVLPLGETVLELEVTNNRPDLLSVYGFARDVATLLRVDLAPPPGEDPEQVGDEPVDVRIEDFEGCPRYVGRLFRDVKVGPSPPWLRARLTAAGMRPISNVVDVTNYVMLGLGNPLHAFDFSTLGEGRVVVRRARPGEEIRTLDGELRKLDPSDLLIADAERGIALAGNHGRRGDRGLRLDDERPARGGELRAGRDLEELASACACAPRDRTAGRRASIPTWPSRQPCSRPQLLVELTGARWTGHTDVQGELPERALVPYRPEKADAGGRARAGEGRAGGDARASRLRARGQRLPRPDLARARPDARDRPRRGSRAVRARRRPVHAPAPAGHDRPADARAADAPAARGRARRPRLRRGRSRRPCGSTIATRTAIRLEEPISIELAILRTELLPSLVDYAGRNVEAGNRNIALFEIAHVYLPRGEDLPDEPLRVAGILEGGFAEVKGVVEAIYGALKATPLFAPGRAPSPPPGQDRADRGRASSARCTRPRSRAAGAPSSSTSTRWSPSRAIRCGTRT